MAKIYRVTPPMRIFNRMMRTMIQFGIGPKQTRVLTVKGRKTGRLYSTPVSLVIDGEQRWLVAPYGEVNWVKNARAAGEVTLSRGGRSETVRIEEVSVQEGAPVLKRYLAAEPITRPYFDAAPDAPPEAFAAEASRHPVFRIVPDSA